MKINTNNPNTIGEELRAQFFKPPGIGCYTTFKLQNDVKELPPEPTEWFDLTHDPPTLITNHPDPQNPTYYTCATKNNIKMRYYWDGDGYLEFQLPNGTTICNHDCKKQNWQYQHPTLKRLEP